MLDGLIDAAFEHDELSSSLQFPEIDGKVPAKAAMRRQRNNRAPFDVY
jgi:hypothetical protein